MTNADKFKTAQEREDAFNNFCANKDCASCELKKTYEEGASCEFTWLELESEDEKIEPCPFCGSECERNNDVYGANYVNCTNYDCLYSSGNAQTIEDAIAAHNRVARAVRNAKRSK